MYIIAGMPYKDRFIVLKENKSGKRLVFDKLVNKYGIQFYDEINYYEKSEAEKLFSKLK